MTKKRDDDGVHEMSNEDMAKTAAKQGRVRETFKNQGNDEQYVVEHEVDPAQVERDKLIEAAQANADEWNKTVPAREAIEREEAEAQKAAGQAAPVNDENDDDEEEGEGRKREHDKKRK